MSRRGNASCCSFPPVPYWDPFPGTFSSFISLLEILVCSRIQCCWFSDFCLRVLLFGRWLCSYSASCCFGPNHSPRSMRTEHVPGSWIFPKVGTSSSSLSFGRGPPNICGGC